MEEYAFRVTDEVMSRQEKEAKKNREYRNRFYDKRMTNSLKRK